MQPTLNVLDLFSGCGGFSLGAHQAGLNVKLAVDIDPILTSSFRCNFPKTRLLLQDISTLEGRDVLGEIGPIDGIFGGPPCQAFSAMGHRRVDDPRRELLIHFFRLVSEISPAFFVAENVQGLQFKSSEDTLSRGLDYVRSKYQIVGPLLLNVADYGGATRRQRVFIIGLDPSRCEGLTIDDVQRAETNPATVRQAIGDLQDATFLREYGSFDIWRINKKGRPSRYASEMRAANGEFTGHLPTAHTKQIVRRFAKVRAGEIDRIGRHPRLAWDGQCPTLRAGTGSDRGSYQSVRPIHPSSNRVITVREAARLQGFPDRFRFHPTVWHSFRMIGNSVSPIMARALFGIISSKLIRPEYGVAAE